MKDMKTPLKDACDMNTSRKMYICDLKVACGLNYTTAGKMPVT
jgi:hypothetical protein